MEGTTTDQPVDATCHCGAITITLDKVPDEITQCNCSLCRSYGVIWAYCEADALTVPAGLSTDTYAWNGKNVDFHRCNFMRVRDALDSTRNRSQRPRREREPDTDR